MPDLRVLISAPYMLSDLNRFLPEFDRAGIEVIPAEVTERLEQDELLEYAGEIDGVICGDDRFTRHVLQAAVPRLKVISKWGTGIDSIDQQAAEELGVEICNTPGAFTEAVADTVLGYVLAFARRLPWMDARMKAGEWNKQPGRALHECSLGVIGVGRIGKAVLRRASAFGMTLYGNDRIDINTEFLDSVPVQMSSLEGLLQQSDFVSLNCDLNPSSRGLIGPQQLERMPTHSVLINTARGPIVVEQALVEALEAGGIGGAALDVFEREPLPADSPLRTMDNVMLAPHNSNASPSAWERVHWNTIRNLLQGLDLPVPEQVKRAAAGDFGAVKGRPS